MTQQPTLFSQGASAQSHVSDHSSPPIPVRGAAPASPSSSPAPQPPHTPGWLQFLELSVRVVVRIYLGLFIVALPWTHFWTDNRYLLLYPHLAMVMLNGATRGIVSGLGLLNIWIGIDDAIHHNEP